MPLLRCSLDLLLLLGLVACSSEGDAPAEQGAAGSGGVAPSGDPCRSKLSVDQGEDALAFQPKDLPGDILWVETPEITHEKDYFSYAPFVKPGVPSNWLQPRNLLEGQLWLRVEVLETPPGAEFPIYYTVTWGPGKKDAMEGFLRAAIAIDKPGPAVYDAVADVRSLEYSPDGTCCQSVCGKPWPWQDAWEGIAGDVVVLQGKGFPLKVKARLVLRPAN